MILGCTRLQLDAPVIAKLYQATAELDTDLVGTAISQVFEMLSSEGLTVGSLPAPRKRLSVNCTRIDDLPTDELPMMQNSRRRYVD